MLYYFLGILLIRLSPDLGSSLKSLTNPCDSTPAFTSLHLKTGLHAILIA
jgi:hypothetical protein